MDIIRNANILNQEDLSLLENHSLDEIYNICNYTPRKRVTRLMLLIDLLYKYPSNQINDIVNKYTVAIPNEINNYDEYGVNAIQMCASLNHFETMRILLNNGINNNNNKDNWIWMVIYYLEGRVSLFAIKLLIEYDVTSRTLHSGEISKRDKVNKLTDNITSLNVLV